MVENEGIAGHLLSGFSARDRSTSISARERLFVKMRLRFCGIPSPSSESRSVPEPVYPRWLLSPHLGVGDPAFLRRPSRPQLSCRFPRVSDYVFVFVPWAWTRESPRPALRSELPSSRAHDRYQRLWQLETGSSRTKSARVAESPTYERFPTPSCPDGNQAAEMGSTNIGDERVQFINDDVFEPPKIRESGSVVDEVRLQ